MPVHLVTCAAMPGLHGDDRHLLNALEQVGVSVTPVVWEDPFVEWSAAEVTVIRSAWDYAFRRRQFVEWAFAAEASTRLWNSASMVEWNTHKNYLVDLAGWGVPTVETVVFPAGSKVDLEAELEQRGWSDVVIKAAVAQSGRYAIRARDAATGQVHLDRYLAHEDMLLQPYVDAIAKTGEVSVVWIDGEVTHAVRKRSTSSDFRVHSDYGGSTVREEPTDSLLEATESAVAGLSSRPLYARIDLVEDPDAGPLVMEFELIEPELFFGMAPSSARRLAAAILPMLDQE